MIPLIGDPVFVQRNKLPHALNEQVFWHRWHLHTFRRYIETLQIVMRPENKSIAAGIFICLNAFKNCLSVMNSRHGWAHQQGLIGLDLNIFPFSLFVIRLQHMIGEIPAKRNVFKRNIVQLTSFYFCNRYAESCNHVLIFCSYKETNKLRPCKNSRLLLLTIVSRQSN